MTIKLFYEDTKLTDFTAVVTQCTQDKNGYWITLDRTAFFPEEGGQSADTGTLQECPVLDVQPQGDEIRHLLAAPLCVGAAVTGHVDYERRFDFMQQHSGEHILSGLLHTHYDLANVGFHLSDREVTLDMNGLLTMAQLREIELLANQAVWKNLPVRAFFPKKDELAAMQYRSKIEIDGDIRIVDIPGIDTCACCAPHVAFTGEIGMIKILKMQSHRGGMRITIACGRRALLDHAAKLSICDAAGTRLSVPEEKLLPALERLLEENVSLKYTIGELSSTLLSEQVKSLASPAVSKNAFLFVAQGNMPAIRNTVNDLTGRYTGYCGIFSGTEDSGYSFILGSSTCDCRNAAALLRERLGAKCGGSAPMIQGSVTAAPAVIVELLEAL